MDERPVTAAEFRRFVRETGHVTVAERTPDRRGVPGRRPRAARAGLARLPPDAGPGAAERLPQLVGVPAGRVLEAAGRPRHDDQRARPPSRRPRRLRGRRGLRDLGRERSSPARPSGSSPRAAGSTARAFAWGDEEFPDGRPMANFWQGEFPWQNLKHRRLRGHLAGRLVPAERLRALRRLRERLGVDVGLLRRYAAGRRARVLRSSQPARDRRRRKPRRGRAGREHTAARDQGRLAPLRSELLPAVSPVGAPGRAGRHVHGPHRLSLHRPNPLKERRHEWRDTKEMPG